MMMMMMMMNDDEEEDEKFACRSIQVLFDQQNLSDLIRDLSLCKESSEKWASWLKDQNPFYGMILF